MSKYTYADVIIDPNDPRVEIGKTYFFALGAQACIDYANRGVRERTLERIDESLYNPFIGDEKDYPFIIRKKKLPYAASQAKWIADNDVKKGDKVRIVRKADKNEGGWGVFWNPDMDEAVGKVGTVRHIPTNWGASGIEVDVPAVSLFLYPYFVLEKVEEPKKKYVPFDLNNEEDRAKLRGAWVRIKGSRRLEQQIVALAIATQLVFLPDVVSVETKELLEGYEFLDGTPCGIVVEDEQ